MNVIIMINVQTKQHYTCKLQHQTNKSSYCYKRMVHNTLYNSILCWLILLITFANAYEHATLLQFFHVQVFTFLVCFQVYTCICATCNIYDGSKQTIRVCKPWLHVLHVHFINIPLNIAIYGYLYVHGAMFMLTHDCLKSLSEYFAIIIHTLINLKTSIIQPL